MRLCGAYYSAALPDLHDLASSGLYQFVINAYGRSDGKLKVGSRAGLLPFATQSRPLHGVYILSNGNPPSDGKTAEFTLLKHVEAVRLMLRHDFMLPALARAQVAQLLATLSRMTRAVPVWRLVLAHGLQLLPEAVCAILEHQDRVGSSPSGSETRSQVA